MFCPIALHAWHTRPADNKGEQVSMDFKDTYCKESECAWYCQSDGYCALKLIARNLEKQ